MMASIWKMIISFSGECKDIGLSTTIWRCCDSYIMTSCDIFFICLVFSPPENDSFRKDLCFAVVFFSFFSRVTSELRRPIGAKFCTMLDAVFNFIIPVQNFGGASPKHFRGQKHAKFGPISVDFEVWRRISPERMKILKIGELLVWQWFLPR